MITWIFLFFVFVFAARAFKAAVSIGKGNTELKRAKEKLKEFEEKHPKS